tara:strand:+ start:38273 stop:38422 length:150 start_codon:yes stop_codon:yes gene_type:complete
MAINVKTNERTSKQLTALSNKRKDEHSLNKTKQDIVAELVEVAFKKECK